MTLWLSTFLTEQLSLFLQDKMEAWTKIAKTQAGHIKRASVVNVRVF